jgi:hypothetical protein
MTKSNPEYWGIMEANFPQASHDHHKELKSDLEKAEILEQRRLAMHNARLNQIIQASEDPAITGYFIDGAGTEEGLIAHIQRQHGLSETEAFSAIDLGIGKLREIVGYGDEA